MTTSANEISESDLVRLLEGEYVVYALTENDSYTTGTGLSIYKVEDGNPEFIYGAEWRYLEAATLHRSVDEAFDILEELGVKKVHTVHYKDKFMGLAQYIVTRMDEENDIAEEWVEKNAIDDFFLGTDFMDQFARREIEVVSHYVTAKDLKER